MTVERPDTESVVGWVVCRVIDSTVDSSDADQLPDLHGVPGVVTFTPKDKVVRGKYTNGTSAYVLRKPIVGRLDADGYLYTPTSATDPTPLYVGMQLIAGTYTVSFALAGGGTVDSQTAVVTSQHTLTAPLDLASLYTAPPAGATVTTLVVPALVAGRVLGNDGNALQWVAAVTSVAGRTGAVTLAKADVGLSAVDNTADADKPVSTATASALSGKAAASHTHAIADTTGLQAALDGKQAAGSYAAASHTHAVADTTGLQAALDGKAASSHTHTASQISDSTTVGRSVVTAADAAAARTAIGAGTSSLALGTTGTTAAAGNDARLSDARTPLAHTHGVADLTATGTKDATTFLRGDNSWAVPAGGGSSAQVDVYYATGSAGSQSTYTWTKPAGAKMVHVRTIQGGSGGGSGRRGAAGTARVGGGGGSAGLIGAGLFPASDFAATETVKVGKGGAGGASVTTDDTNGNGGGAGGVSAFGKLSSWAGGGGGGGQAGAGGGGGASGNVAWMSYYVASGGTSVAPASGGASATGGNGTSASSYNQGHAPTAGGGGGGITSADVASNGGAGGYHNWGPAAAAGGAPGGAGNPGGIVHGLGMGGSGGGASITGAAGAGGAGGSYGGGGGGGGASLNGNASGAGGAGGDGIVIITTYF